MPAHLRGGVTLRVMTWNLWWRFGPWERASAGDRRRRRRAAAGRAPAAGGVERRRRPLGRPSGRVPRRSRRPHRRPPSARRAGRLPQRDRQPLAADDVDSRPLPGATGGPAIAGCCSPTWTRRGGRGRWPPRTSTTASTSRRSRAPGGSAADVVVERRGDPDRGPARRSSAATSTRCPTATRSACSPGGVPPVRPAAERLLGAGRRRARATWRGTTRTRPTRRGRTAGSTTCWSAGRAPSPRQPAPRGSPASTARRRRPQRPRRGGRRADDAGAAERPAAARRAPVVRRMATLRFSFGTMGSGKSTMALQIHHNLAAGSAACC